MPGQILQLPGDARTELSYLQSDSIQAIITSPPYLGLRNYSVEPSWWGEGMDCQHDLLTILPPGARSVDSKPGPLQTPGTVGRDQWQSQFCSSCQGFCGQLGGEPDVQTYTRDLLMILNACKRVLSPTGVLWLVLGDTYAGPSKGSGGKTKKQLTSAGTFFDRGQHLNEVPGKNLLGVPWEVALALRSAGWYLRSSIIWSKPNPMPESMKDRPERSYEYIFMLTKSPRYKYHKSAVPEARLNVWPMQAEPTGIPHYAAFPTELVRRCILLSTDPGDMILDPFAGIGTTNLVAQRLDRPSVYVEPSAEYNELFVIRLKQAQAQEQQNGNTVRGQARQALRGEGNPSRGGQRGEDGEEDGEDGGGAEGEEQETLSPGVESP